VAASAAIRTFRALGADLPDVLKFRTQASGLDQKIPDLVGESDGIQHLIVEAKFWAGLTDAQPVTYLNRVREQGRGSVVFVVPALRAEGIWHELRRRCLDRNIAFTEDLATASGSRFARLPDSASGLGLIAWRDLLSSILAEIELVGERNTASDLRQLQGLCNREDADAFLPLSSDELTNCGFAKRIIQFSDLVDDLTTRLVEKKMADTRGLRATATKGRYGRYMRIHNVESMLYFGAAMWGNRSPTPIWLRVIGSNWNYDPRIGAHLPGRALQSHIAMFETQAGIEIPIRLSIGEERDEVTTRL
jgi:hypothetical protein